MTCCSLVHTNLYTLYSRPKYFWYSSIYCEWFTCSSFTLVYIYAYKLRGFSMPSATVHDSVLSYQLMVARGPRLPDPQCVHILLDFVVRCKLQAAAGLSNIRSTDSIHVYMVPIVSRSSISGVFWGVESSRVRWLRMVRLVVIFEWILRCLFEFYFGFICRQGWCETAAVLSRSSLCSCVVGRLHDAAACT